MALFPGGVRGCAGRVVTVARSADRPQADGGEVAAEVSTRLRKLRLLNQRNLPLNREGPAAQPAAVRWLAEVSTRLRNLRLLNQRDLLLNQRLR